MTALKVLVENSSGCKLEERDFSSLGLTVLRRLGFNTGELGVSFVDPEEMERLNRQFMDRAGPTDVLSFPLDADDADIDGDGEIPRLLGDVIICPEIAAVQAPALGNTVREELCLLLIHGILHIAGYDHEIDEGQMDKIQTQLFAELCKDRAGHPFGG